MKIKLFIILYVLWCFTSFAQKKFGFWDHQFNEPIIIKNDSTILRGINKQPYTFKSLDLDKSKLINLTPLQIKDTTYLVEDSGGIVVKYYNREFKRIDNSFTHHNQYGSISFVYNDEIYLLGGYGLFTHKNILTQFNFKTGDWYLKTTTGEVPRYISNDLIHKKIGDEIYFVVSESLKYDEDFVWYRLDLKTWTFYRLGVSSIDKATDLRSYHRNDFSKYVLHKVSGKALDKPDRLILFDLKNNTYITVKDQSFNYLASKRTKILTKANNKLLLLYLTPTVERKTNELFYKFIDDVIYTIPKNAERFPIYDEKIFNLFPFVLIFIISTLIFTVLYFLNKKRKTEKYVIVNIKDETIIYKSDRLSILDEKELDILFLIAEFKDSFVPYNRLLDVTNVSDNSYETSRKNRKIILESITKKIQNILSDMKIEVFIYKTDPRDKRAKLIQLNPKIFLVIE